MGTPNRFWTGLFLAAVFVALLYLLRDVLLPFVAGLVIAYFLNPVAQRLQRLGLSRTWATVTLTVAFFLLLVGVLLVLLPVFYEQLVAFINRLPVYADRIGERVHPLLVQVQSQMTADDLARLRANLGGMVGSMARWSLGVIQGLVSGGLALVNLLAMLVITPVVTFYILRDWSDLTSRFDTWLPRPYAATIREQLGEMDAILAGFMRGQSLVCLALGTFYAVGLSLVGLELGLVVGMGAGLISFIPYLGSITGFVVGVGMAVAQGQGWELPLMVAGVFLVGQTLEGYVLSPNLVGDRVQLHPVWMMFALLAGGSLFGFLGILLAVPVVAVLGVLIRYSIKRYLAGNFYRGQPPS